MIEVLKMLYSSPSKSPLVASYAASIVVFPRCYNLLRKALVSAACMRKIFLRFPGRFYPFELYALYTLAISCMG
jgi:hypothetical protein